MNVAYNLEKGTHGYKPSKPLDVFPMSPHAKVCKSVESFPCKIQDLHI